jgi:hypothetical protein
MAEKKFPKEGKVFKVRSSALRAAKDDGLHPGQFDIHGDEKSKEYYYLVTEVHKSVASQFKENKSNTRPVNEPKRKPKKSVAEDVLEDEDPEELEAVRAEIQKEKAELGPDPKLMGEQEIPEVVLPDPSIPDEEAIKGGIVIPDPVIPDEQAFKAERVLKEPSKKLVVQSYDDPKPVETPTVVVPEAVKPDLSHLQGDVKSATSGQSSVVVKNVPLSEQPIKNRLHKSKVESPTKLVWDIAEEMKAKNPHVTRKQVIAECQVRGIAYFTARTQYQQWLTTKRESDKNQEKASSSVEIPKVKK